MVWSVRTQPGGTSVRLSQGIFTIGRAACCDMVLSDPAVSSSHCTLLCDGDGGLTVEDRSTNGTYVNRMRLPKGQRRSLASGDTILLSQGAVKLSFEYEADETEEVPVRKKLRKLSVFEGQKLSTKEAVCPSKNMSKSESPPGTAPHDEGGELGILQVSVRLRSASESVPSKLRDSNPAQSAESSGRLSPQTPLDLDIEAIVPGSSFRAEKAESGPVPKGRKRKLERAKTFVGHLSAPALLQWLTKRRCNRQEESTTTEPVFSRSGEERRRAERYLQEQVHFFHEEKDGEEKAGEIILLSPPEMIGSLRSSSFCKGQKGFNSDGFTTVLPSTRLQTDPFVAARATDQWDSIHKSVISEAAKAFTRSKLPKAAFTPWKSQESFQEASDLECALQILQDRSDLEPGRRVLMRRAGAQPKAGLFVDPPQHSAEASAAAQAAQSGVLAALATKNDFQAATFLSEHWAESLRHVRPGVLGTWQTWAWNEPRGRRQQGFRDVLHCCWASREFCLGISGHFVGRRMRAGQTQRAFGLSGGQEHGMCSCGEWLTRSKVKAHACDKYVGKPHDTSNRLKVFWQTRGLLAFRVLFKHQLNPPAVDLTLEAALESALTSLMWSDYWGAAHVTCSWRLCVQPNSKQSPAWAINQTRCEAVPAQPSAGAPLTSQQLILLGWMRLQEARSSYTSRQIIREDLCETDVCLELLVERDFNEKGGLIFRSSGCNYIQRLAPLLTSLDDCVAPLRQRHRGRCLLDAPGTLVLVQAHMLPSWKAALQDSAKILCIPNHKKMRSLKVADLVAAEVILASLQLFGSEGYQRHFDSLSKPGLEVWEANLPEPPVADDGGEGGEETLACGDLVELHSLVASEMNGRKGRLLEWQEASGRWSCLLLGQPQGSRKRSRKGERQEKGSLVNVKPCNLKRIGRVRAANKKQRRGIPEPQTRVSKYYAELRAREDYMARRQVDLERQTLRLMRQAAKSSEPWPMALANSGAVLEMFHFNRLVLDDCQLLARDLEQIISGGAPNSLALYLTKVAPLYAVHAIRAQSRWGLADLECLKARQVDMAPMASLLGIQIPWGDAVEAQRFLDAWATDLDGEDGLGTSRSPEALGAWPSGVEEEVHLLDFSLKEHVAYLFRSLERSDELKTPRQRSEHVRSLLQMCCEPVNLEELVKETWSQQRLKSADATLAEEEYKDFELRLQVFQSLAAATTSCGYEREVLLAAAHSGTEQLQSFSSNLQGLEALELQLRHLAQATLEPGAPSAPTLGRPSTHRVGACQACDRLTRPREVLQSLRSAQQRAEKAQQRASRRWRLLQVLLEAAGLPLPEGCSPHLLCHCGAQATRLCGLCGRVACGHETCECGEAVKAVSLEKLTKSKEPERLHGSKLEGMVQQIREVLSSNPKVQCLVFSQWSSTLRKFEDALSTHGLEYFISGRKATVSAETKKPILLLTPDFLYGEKQKDRKEKQKNHAPLHQALDGHCTTRHVFFTNAFYMTPVKGTLLERKIVDFAKANQLGIASKVVLHRFVMGGTIEANADALQQN